LADLRGKVKATFNNQKNTGVNIYNSFGARVMKWFEGRGNIVWFRIHSTMCYFKCHFVTMYLIHILWLLEFYFSKSSNYIKFVKYTWNTSRSIFLGFHLLNLWKTLGVPFQMTTSISNLNVIYWYYNWYTYTNAIMNIS